MVAYVSFCLCFNRNRKCTPWVVARAVRKLTAVRSTPPPLLPPPFTPKKGVYLDPYLIVVYIIFNYVLT